MEYAINNTINRSTGKSPSQLVFGLDQRGKCEDNLKILVGNTINSPTRDLQDIRKQAAERISQSQQQQKADYDRKRKAPKTYEKGDMVMVKNFDNTPGVSRKTIPRFRGPYEIDKVLRNNRYVITDPPGFQNTQKLYTGTWDVNNLRPWLTPKDPAPDQNYK